MASAFLEHVNVTVKDPEATAQNFVDWFGWHVRWHGPAKDNGVTFHVGSDTSYIALYSKGGNHKADHATYVTQGGLNHLAVVVDDLDATEKRVLASGFKTHSHSDYEPGKRFYFYEENGIEVEVVSYSH
ncbi:VOC family protein [Roseibium sp. RKSG952]|uniref:VOC family protein n=1 Tax=Roseibium sp. RKSG952 TaxID=2529384 RepID=UPI0012BBB6C7|nr:VOC family protein [Roseibium sp. RKSG952]MTH98975.1 VOC family protein [Roseibium sp. RKSG952]